MEYFFVAVSLLPYLLAAGLGLAFPLLLLACYNHFGVGLALVALTILAETLNLGQPILRIGITLFVPDIPMVLIGLAAGLRWVLRSDVPRRHFAWVLLALVFFVDLAIGLARHGTAAGVQGRSDFYAITAGTYAMTFPISKERVRQLFQAFSLIALALMLVCAYRWIVYYLPIRELLPPGGEYNQDGAIRVIGANVALVIADMLVIGLFFTQKEMGAGVARWLSPLMLAVVLVLQHRSVWLAGIVGLLLCLLLARTHRVPLWQQIFVLALVVVTAVSPLFLSGTVSEQVQNSAARAVAGEGTVSARFENWRSTLQQWWGDGAKAIVMGRELGSDTTRVVDTERGAIKIRYGVHNHYIDVLTNLGVLGLAGTLMVFIYSAIGLLRQALRRDEDSPYSAMLLVLLGIQLTFYVAYTVDYLQYLALGLSMAWVAGHAKPQPATAAVPVPKAVSFGLRRSTSQG
jgi:uncharacterized membrane protein